MTKGNSNQTAGDQAQNWAIPLSGLRRIRAAASRHQAKRFRAPARLAYVFAFDPK